jgi:hypothetical protein
MGQDSFTPDSFTPDSNDSFKPDTTPVSMSLVDRLKAVKHKMDGKLWSILEPRLDQLQGKEEGPLNPNPVENPLIGGSILPKAHDATSWYGKGAQAIYNNLIRPTASPLGILGIYLGKEPHEYPGLGETLGNIGENVGKDIELPAATKVATTAEEELPAFWKDLIEKKIVTKEKAKQLNDSLMETRKIVKDTAIDNTLSTDNLPDETKANVSEELPFELRSNNVLGKDLDLPLNPSAEPAPAASKAALTGEQLPPQVPPNAAAVNPSPANDFSNRLANWVNHRASSAVAGFRNKKTFESLDNGIQGILDYQENPTAPQFKSLSDYFSGKRGELLSTGLQLGDKGDSYLPQLWDNSPEEIQAAIQSGRLGLKPSFAFNSVLENYKAGLEAGLKPKFENISDLAGWYERTAEKSIADRNFWNSMIEAKEISPIKTDTATVALDPNITPNFVGDGNTRVWYAAPEVASKISNVLSKPVGPLETVANVAGHIKNLQMSVGIPKTGFSPHGFTILARGAFSDPASVPTLLKHMIMPSTGINSITDAVMDGTVERAMKAGMTFSSEEHTFPGFNPAQAETVLSKIGDIKNNLFEKPVFGSLVPAAKISTFETVEKSMLSKGLSPEVSAKVAAHFANDAFGGINVKELGRNPNFQAALRSMFFAPDFAETNINMAKKGVQSLINYSDPTLAPYRKFTLNLAVAYTAANLLNKKLSGHYMFQNDPMHSFDLETGKTDSKGKNQHIRIFGSAADAERLASEAASAVQQNRADKIPDMVRSRLAPTANLTLDLIKNTDFAGRPILGPDRYGKPQSGLTQVGNALRVVTDRTLPAGPQVLSDYAQDKTSGENLFARSLGLPITYSSDFERAPSGSFRVRP